MAGSYQHCVDDQGKLLANEQLQGMLECCSGDVYEAIQEMYGMIWWLAYQNTLSERRLPSWSPAEWVTRARAQDSVYRGIDVSPGVDGGLPDGDD